MSSIRDAVKTTAGIAAAGAAVGGGIAMANDKDLSQIGSSAMYAAAGAVLGAPLGVGLVAGKTAGRIYGKAAGVGLRAGSFSRFGDAAGRMAGSMNNISRRSLTMGALAGSLGGSLFGAGYATLESNKAKNPSYSDRLKFETARKKMTVDANLEQMRQMRQIMAETRLK